MQSRVTRQDEAADLLLAASRALVAIAARSVAHVEGDLTLPQYRALVVLDTEGPQRAIDLAAGLDVSPSTASRMCDRLVRKKLIKRALSSADRREVRLQLSPTGEEIVREVTGRRRREFRRILAAMPESAQDQLIAALRTFAEAAGESTSLASSLEAAP